MEFLSVLVLPNFIHQVKVKELTASAGSDLGKNNLMGMGTGAKKNDILLKQDDNSCWKRDFPDKYIDIPNI